MHHFISRRRWLRGCIAGSVAAMAGWPGGRRALADEKAEATSVAGDTLKFIQRCARDDGAYAPSPDPDYRGRSDTLASDLAAVTYAAVLARTMGWKLANAAKSIAFIHRHQQPDGRFINLAGQMKPDDDLAILYNTTQGCVALRALGERPRISPAPVMRRFFEHDAYKKLPWYTTSFFPLFYAAIDQPYPAEYRQALADHMIRNQREDGYIQDHVASTFHMAHYFRLIGEPTPKAQRMVQRVMHDQKADGGWNIKQPDWDVHACFDALFILRQLGGDSPQCRAAISRGADWALLCRNADGGFGHFPGEHSDMDAVYFQFGALIQAGKVPGAKLDLSDGHTLGWGHAMEPGKKYG